HESKGPKCDDRDRGSRQLLPPRAPSPGDRKDRSGQLQNERRDEARVKPGDHQYVKRRGLAQALLDSPVHEVAIAHQHRLESTAHRRLKAPIDLTQQLGPRSKYPANRAIAFDLPDRLDSRRTSGHPLQAVTLSFKEEVVVGRSGVAVP